MPIALKVKQKAAPKSATAAVVDRIVELRKQIDAVAPLMKEHEKLVKELRDQAMAQDPAQVVVYEGTDHNVVFSEAIKVRKLVDMEEVRKALGKEIFFKVAKVTLTDIDKYLTPDEIEPLIVREYGARKVDVVEK